MSILLTGAAGFIGFHVAKALLERGKRVLGIDNLNEYCDVRLKDARLSELRRFSNVIHLAAQAGVLAYNLTRVMNLLGSKPLLAAIRA